MLEFLQGIFNATKEFSKSSPIVAGAISLYGLGIMTYLMRDIPKRIGALLQKHFTTTLFMTSQHDSFHKFISWLDEKGYSNKFRKFKLSNGRWGGNNKADKGIGYGTHFFFYGKFPMVINLSKEESRGDYDKETITLSKLGRSHKVIDKLIKEFSFQKDDNKLKVCTYHDKEWYHNQKQPKRSLDSIFLEKDKKDLLLNTFKDFEDREDWYLEHGIPYRLGLLFHGSPGTGKSSLIKSLGGHLNRNIYLMKASDLYSLSSAVRNLPEKSILVIEDFDSNSLTKKRSNLEDISETEEPKSVQTESESVADKVANILGGGISEVLNAIDGIVDTHGRILILTTNKIEDIDPAILRPGRIDLKIKIGFANKEIFISFMKSFFPDFVVPDGKVKHRTSVAVLQQKVLLKYTPEKICEEFLTEGDE